MGAQEHNVRLDTCEADLQSAVLEWREQLLKDQKFSVKRVNSLSNDLRRFFDFYACHLGFMAGLVSLKIWN